MIIMDTNVDKVYNIENGIRFRNSEIYFVKLKHRGAEEEIVHLQ